MRNSIELSSNRIPLNNGAVLIISNIPSNAKNKLPNLKKIQKLFDGLTVDESKLLVTASKFSKNFTILDSSSNTSS